MDIISIIVLLGTSQGIFLGLILFTAKKGNQRANQVLGLLMMVISINLLYVIITADGVYQQLPHLLMLNYPLQYLYGPLILLYVLYLTRPEFEIRPKHSVHLLPVLLSAIYFSITVYLKPAHVKIDIYLSMMNPVEFKDYFWGLTHIIYNIPYLIAAARILQKHKTRIQQTFSYMEKINLQWLQFLIIGFISVFALNTVFDLMYVWHIYEGFGGPAMGVIATILIYTIGYKGLRQPEIFISGTVLPDTKQDTTKELTLEQREKLSSQIQKIMQRDKPYLDPSLTIKDLANQAKIPDYRLSQLINDHFEKNFFEFVNTYRIEEAKQRLQDPGYENFTILAIANDVGFNSKSSFNTAFKRFTQKTPSAYRQSAG